MDSDSVGHRPAPTSSDLDLEEILDGTIASISGYHVHLLGLRDESGEIVDFAVEGANDRVCDALGLTLEELRQATVGELLGIAGGDDDEWRSLLTRMLMAGRPFEGVVETDHPLAKSAGLGRTILVRMMPTGDRIFLTATNVSRAQEIATEAQGAQEQFRRAMEASNIGVAIGAKDGAFIEFANPALARMLGLAPEQVRGKGWRELVRPDDRVAFDRLLTRIDRDPGTSHSVSLHLSTPDRHSVLVDIVATPGATKKTAVYQVTDRTLETRALASAEERTREFQMLASSVSDGVLRMDPSGVVTWVSPSTSSLLGLPESKIVGRPIDVFVDREHARALYAAVLASAAGSEAPELQIRTAGGDRPGRWVAALTRPIRSARDAVEGVVLSLRDVDTEVAARESLEAAAMTDALTGLGTREALVGRLRETVSGPAPALAALKISIDHVGRLNEALTYAGGDVVITTLAERIVATVGDRDHVFRTGGGDFDVLLIGVESVPDVMVKAEAVRECCTQALTVGTYTVTPTVSIGAAVTVDDDVDGLLDRTHAAMRTAKARGRDQVALADGEWHSDASAWLVDEAALHEALEENRYTAHFQPITALADGTLVGFEALARCQMPDGSITLPVGQMLVAEATGRIRQIDRRSVVESLALLTALPDRYFVSLNASVLSLEDRAYLPWVEQQLHDANVDPWRLHIEVTESAALRVSDEVRDRMERLTDQGVTWYLDDFGTGFSSLASLRDLPMGGLKLDRTYTAALVLNPGRIRNLTRGLVGLAHELGLQTVAEGVETEAEVEVLLSQGWDYGQGWLYGKAMTAADALTLAAGAGGPPPRLGPS